MGRSFKLTPYSANEHCAIPILEEDVEEIRRANVQRVAGLAIEEKLDLVLENYAELERTLLDLALKHSIFPGSVDAILEGSVRLLNRRLVNLMTATKLYVDQISHEMSALFGKESEQYREFKEGTNEQYDTVLGYRVMETLRNHSQHRGLPVNSMWFPMSRDDDVDPPQILFRVRPEIYIAALEQDPKVKKSITQELRQLAADDGVFPSPEKTRHVAVMPLVRDYVQSIAVLHQRVRQRTADTFEKANAVIDRYRKMYRQACGEELPGLAAITVDEDGCYAEYEYLSELPSERRVALLKKNRLLSAIARSYVSAVPEPSRRSTQKRMQRRTGT